MGDKRILTNHEQRTQERIEALEARVESAETHLRLMAVVMKARGLLDVDTLHTLGTYDPFAHQPYSSNGRPDGSGHKH